MKASEPDRLKTQIDFSATRGHPISSLIYTVLMHYNRGGSTGLTASELIIEAFRIYDYSESLEFTLLLDAQTRTSSFINRYNITKKIDIKDTVKNRELETDITLLEPGKKFFCFDTEDPYTEKLWDILKDLRYRDRAAFINTFLFQYFAHGKCSYYNSLCSERILAWLKDEHVIALDIGNSERFEKMIDLIWTYSGGIYAPYRILEDETDGLNSEDKLRKAMGIL